MAHSLPLEDPPDHRARGGDEPLLSSEAHDNS